jgi:NADH-quinone oxidoreductase subunit M
MPNALSLLVLFPLLGALAIVFIPANYRFLIRVIALFASGLSLLAGLAVFLMFDPAAKAGTFQFVQAISWVSSLGIQLKLGVDGINVGIILMGVVVAFAATCV